MAYPGDSIDLGYAGMNTRRGRVGHQIAHTLTTGIQQGTLHFVDLSPPPLVTEHCRCLNKHVNVKYTEDGGALPYDYAKAPLSHEDVTIDTRRLDDYELLSAEELLGREQSF